MGFDPKTWLEDHKGEAVLLGICPILEEIIEAAFQEAREEGFIPMFIATPHQVDENRGYTGWSQGELVGFLNFTLERISYDGPYIMPRDHRGPYQSMRDRDDPEVELETAMGYAKEMFVQDVRKGFDILHVDATEDPRTREILDLDEVMHRTCELITYIEDVRKDEDLSEVYYKVGTEEITGGMMEPDDFEKS